MAIARKWQGVLIEATQLYNADMGFFPPDVNRGWDPGFVQPMPSNPDTLAGQTPPPPYDNPGTNCGHCPANWQTLIQERWSGPYISYWPRLTPWNGKYDYNYWGTGANRFGCPVLPEVYTGIQGDYANNHRIPITAEQKMINKEFEAELCMNGESQMRLMEL